MTGMIKNSVLVKVTQSLLKENKSNSINTMKKLMKRPKKSQLIKKFVMLKVFSLVLLKMENTRKMDFSLIKHKFMKVISIKESNKVMAN